MQRVAGVRGVEDVLYECDVTSLKSEVEERSAVGVAGGEIVVQAERDVFSCGGFAVCDVVRNGHAKVVLRRGVDVVSGVVYGLLECGVVVAV